MKSLNVAKYNLGKVRLEQMQSVVSPLTVCDLRGGPLEICRAFVLRCLSCAVPFADLCGSKVLDLRIFADSRPFPSLPLGCWSLGTYGSGKLFPLIIQCDRASWGMLVEVVPASRVAMDTCPLAYGFCSPLTF